MRRKEPQLTEIQKFSSKERISQRRGVYKFLLGEERISMINVLPSKKKKTPLMVRKPGKTSEILPLEQIFLTKILIWLLHINLQQVECPSPPQKPSLKNHKVTYFLVYNILADFKGLNI